MGYNTNVKIGDYNADSGNITNSFNITGTVNNTIHRSDEDTQIMHWLSPLEPKNRHDGVRADRVAGVGNWLLKTSEFREWRGGEGGVDKAFLFCSGDPGVGKTYLSSLVIDSLCDRARKENMVVACFYCDFLAQQEQTVVNVIGAILKQLVGRKDIPKYLRSEFREGKTELGGRRLLLPDLMGMLMKAIASIPQVFICIDALDEFVPKDLSKLLGSLRDIVRESPKTRIFLTGRPHVREDIQRYFSKLVVIAISPPTDDIRSYLEMRLAGDTDPDAMNDELRADIIRVMQERISDIFLLVSLNIDAILGGVTIRKRRKKLEAMAKGNGLGDAYTATLTRLKGQKGDKSILGLKVLMWVLYSKRPLRAEELCHALGVEVGSPDLDVDNVPTLRTLVASCLGLVTVEESSCTVRLVHHTLKEHLISDPTLFHSPHSTIAEVCLTYLNFKCVRDLPPTLRSAPPATPLLEYASYYWGEHISSEVTGNAKALALRLLDRFDKHISAQLVLLRYSGDRGSGGYFYGWEGPIGFTGLHGAAFIGIGEIIAAILEMKEWDISANDCLGNTALTWGAGRGHEEAVKILLDRGEVNPNQPDTKYGLTPLSWAVVNGHEGIVKMLLGRADVNPNQPDPQNGCTPLSWAAVNGHEGIVKMLLGRADVNPDRPDTYGRTPLLLAAREWHQGIVVTLLQRGDVNSDQADTEYGRTPLSLAAENGCEAVITMILERGADPDQPDTEYGRTALSWAAGNGHTGVVNMLLGRDDVNPDQPDTKYRRTPLSWAAKNGHVGIVKMLLGRDDVNPDQPDTKYGRTPLLWAAKSGNEAIVKMLLERGDVNPDHSDTKYCWTPLSWAAKNGHEWMVKMLLERGDVNPDQPDTKYGRTPLSWAAQNGHVGIVRMLLERADVNPDRPDTYGQTPLWWAASEWHQGIVVTLLERGDVNFDQADTESGRTPLSWAAENGCEAVITMLLERGADPNRVDAKFGRTPLSWAAGSGHNGVVKILLGRGDVNPNQADTEFGRPPLSWAAGNGHEGVLKILLERQDAYPEQVDTKCVRTALSWAAQNGHEGVAKILLERPGVNPDQVVTHSGQTPLSWAAGRGYEGVVKMLLQRRDVNPDQPDSEIGQTPLSWAAEKGYVEIVKMLLHRRGVNPNQADTGYGRTPLAWASQNGHEDVASILLARNDVCIAMPDNANQTPLSWALSKGHVRLVKMLLERYGVTSDTTYPLAGLPSPPQPPGKADSLPTDLSSILPCAPPADRYITITCFVFLLAILVYFLPCSFLDILTLHK